jgi:predicted GNAT family acetyltransferase
MSPHRCERASSEHADGLLALFESAGSGCFCNYWHFAGDKNAWLEQCYIKPELNRAALVARLAEPELCGVVGFDGAGVLRGWLKLMRASGVPRLYDQRVYRNLPCFADTDRESTYAVGCCYISETERGRGLAKALLAAAVSAAQAAGASALEAFPRGAPPAESPPLRPDEVWMGPEALFLEAGFERVSDFRPYPVLRLHLPQ